MTSHGLPTISYQRTAPCLEISDVNPPKRYSCDPRGQTWFPLVIAGDNGEGPTYDRDLEPEFGNLFGRGLRQRDLELNRAGFLAAASANEKDEN